MVAEKKEEQSSILYEISVLADEDLRILIAHLKGFKETIEFNDRTMRVQVWADPKSPDTS